MSDIVSFIVYFCTFYLCIFVYIICAASWRNKVTMMIISSNAVIVLLVKHKHVIRHPLLVYANMMTKT